jgi:hypothetical protein
LGVPELVFALSFFVVGLMVSGQGYRRYGWVGGVAGFAAGVVGTLVAWLSLWLMVWFTVNVLKIGGPKKR